MHLGAPAGNRPFLGGEQRCLNFSAVPLRPQGRRGLPPVGTRHGQLLVGSSVRSISVPAIARWRRQFETGSSPHPLRLGTLPRFATSAASLPDSVARHRDHPWPSPERCGWSATRLWCRHFARCLRLLLRPLIALRRGPLATARWHLRVAEAIV